MRPFEFVFKGTPRESDKTVNAGIELMSGDPLEIATCLGMFAAGMLKKAQPQAAIIVVNAFKKFMELNPDITEQVMRELTFNEGARIIRPTPDDMGNINPLKSIKNN